MAFVQSSTKSSKAIFFGAARWRVEKAYFSCFSACSLQQHRRKHADSPTLPFPFVDGTFQFRFKLLGAERFAVRFEDESRVENAHGHLCRLDFKPTVATLRLDQPPKDCDECHSHEFEEANGGLVVDSKAAMLMGGDLGPSVVPGNPDDKLLLEAMLYKTDALQMPPEGKLDAQTLEYVRQWIELGAPDPRKSTLSEQPTPSGPDASKLWSVAPLIEASPPPAIRRL